MEKTNNTEKNITYTEEEVLSALAKMDVEQRHYLSGYSINEMVHLMNDKEYREKAIENYDWYLCEIPKMKVAILKLRSLVLSDKLLSEPDKKINNMVETYKGLDRKERLELFKKLEEVKTPDNKMDESKYSWSEFISILHEVFDKVVKA